MRRFLALAIALLTGFTATAAEKVAVAAAANLTYVLKPIDAAFEAANPGSKVEVTIASSGNLVAMINQGAPFDVFLSADLDYPSKLVESHHAVEATQVTFAYGKLVLWTTRPGLDLSSIPAVIRDPAVHKLAVANPRTAPYGEAAEQVLAKLHLSDVAADKTIFGENISQTAQFVASGNADAGFVALSLVLAPTLKDRGRWIEVPATMHTPLGHAGILTARGAQSALAKRYLDFLGRPAARALFEKFGYGLPQR